MSHPTLASAWLHRLHTTYPDLSQRLRLGDLFRFAQLASDIHHRADIALKLDATSDMVIPILHAALNLDLAPSDYQKLWSLFYPYLGEIRMDSDRVIRETGHKPGPSSPFTEIYLSPPVRTCLVCTKNASRACEFYCRDRVDSIPKIVTHDSYVRTRVTPGHSRSTRRSKIGELDPKAVTLHRTGTLQGYLYDIDGIHTITIITTQCPSKFSFDFPQSISVTSLMCSRF